MDRIGIKYYDVLQEKYKSILTWITELKLNLPPIPSYELMKEVLESCTDEPKTYTECCGYVNIHSVRVRIILKMNPDINSLRYDYPTPYELLYYLVNLYIDIHFSVPMYENYADEDYISNSFDKYYNAMKPINTVIDEERPPVTYFYKALLPFIEDNSLGTVDSMEYYNEIIRSYDHWMFYIIRNLGFSRECFVSMLTTLFIASLLNYNRSETAEQFSDIFDTKLQEYKNVETLKLNFKDKVSERMRTKTNFVLRRIKLK